MAGRCTARDLEPENPESSSVPTNRTLPDGQYADHWTMCPGEIVKAGLKRPVREWYTHLKCGTDTKMPIKCAETYAANPFFYSRTFCCGCGGYFPVGEDGEFVWRGTQDKVGT